MSSKIHEAVTSRIVAELEQGVAPWVKPWKSGLGGKCLPVNAATDRFYRGVNILTLWAEAVSRGYPLPRWLTFHQARELGGFVRKGEKGTAIVLLKRIDVEDEREDAKGGEGRKEIAFLRYFTVFNVAQVEELPAPFYVEPPAAPEGERLDHAEAFLAAVGAEVRHGGDRACYVPALDRIMLPVRGAFESPAHYYATSLHEHAHYAGHPSRLARDLSGRFGSQAYAAEELIAELTAAFLCAKLGIEGRLRHAEYLGHWLELLKDDARAIFTAASKASQTADYLRGFSTAKATSDEPHIE